jgi:hypothetical protein
MTKKHRTNGNARIAFGISMLHWFDNTTVSCFDGLILQRTRSLEILPIFPQVNVGNLGDVRIMKHDLSALDYNTTPTLFS